MTLCLRLILFLAVAKWRLASPQNHVCRPDLPRSDCGYIDPIQCEESGCCLDRSGGTPACYHSVISPLNPQCLGSDTRIQCGVPKITSEDECETAGCCWNTSYSNQPHCFFSTPRYVVAGVNITQHGIKLILKNSAKSTGQIAAPISPLLLEVTRETESRLHIKITDPGNQRYEIPQSVLPVPPPPSKPLTNYYYDYKFPNKGEEFYLIVKRRYSDEVIFNTSSINFMFSDHLLQIGTVLPSGHYIYGLGEHKTSFRLKPGRTYTLWNYDVQTPENVNLYGSHPFYLEMRKGKAHGVFLRNSDGMDVILNNMSLTYRVIGGVLDFYFFVGELGLPDEVIDSYQEVIGRPAMPPYWALGFHQCRWGYRNLQEVKDVVGNFSYAKIPLDTVWVDIDYMEGYKDFTTNPANFSAGDLKDFISDLHKSGKHFVVIVDPGISTENKYQSYEDGMKMDIFIKDDKGTVFVGKVWPGYTAYPDFLNPNTTIYWEKQISSFAMTTPVDGLWIDMNEPSNFCNGGCFRKSRRSSMGAGFDLYNPPYNLNNQDKGYSLNHKTLDVFAIQYGGHFFFDTHNLYGLTESIATRKALLSINEGKRPFVLSRSTFAGSGRYAAHWLGDNTASAEDMYYSIPGILNFQMFGIPLVGADICGFGGSTTEELCARWMELGAFYPFARNHNTKGAPSQEPYRWSSVLGISRKVLSIRYSLLPYYYTLMYKAHHGSNGSYVLFPSAMLVKPLFFEFYKDTNSYSIDRQFLVGPAIMISPQLELGEKGAHVDIHFPPSTWYDWYNGSSVTHVGGTDLSFSTPLDHIPIHVRGGYIVPMQEPGLTTAESRKNPYSLLVALDHAGGSESFGDLYLDNGETYNTTEYTYLTYPCQGQQLNGYVHGTGYASKHHLPPLTKVTILGVASEPTVVALNGKPCTFTSTIRVDTIILEVTGLNVTMDTDFILNWI